MPGRVANVALPALQGLCWSGVVTVREVLDDWAMRPIVPLTVLRQMTQSLRHVAEFAHLPLEFRDMFHGDALDIGTGT